MLKRRAEWEGVEVLKITNWYTVVCGVFVKCLFSINYFFKYLLTEKEHRNSIVSIGWFRVYYKINILQVVDS